MKYEFIVQPGADPDVIRLAYTGIEGLSIDDTGNLIIHTGLGDVRDTKPYCYQEIDGKEIEVACNFKLFPLYQEGIKGCVVNTFQSNVTLSEGEGSRNEILRSTQNDNRGWHGQTRLSVLNGGKATTPQSPPSQGGDKGEVSVQKCSLTSVPSTPDSQLSTHEYGFELADYNTNYPLVIDPGLEYSTFLGGSDNDGGFGIAVDGSGNAYVTGYTYDSTTDFPTTTGAYDEGHNGDFDVFVSKLGIPTTSTTTTTLVGPTTTSTTTTSTSTTTTTTTTVPTTTTTTAPTTTTATTTSTTTTTIVVLPCLCPTGGDLGCISGRATKISDGSLLAGKVVKLKRKSPRKPKEGKKQVTVTDSNGCYSFTNLIDGTYLLKTKKCKGGVKKQYVTISGGAKVNDVNFTCKK